MSADGAGPGGPQRPFETITTEKTSSADTALARYKDHIARQQARRATPEAWCHSWVVLLGAVTFILQLIGLNGILPDSGGVAFVRNILIAGGAALVLYGVGKYAISQGAYDAALGSRSAVALAVGGTLLVGTVTIPTTYFATARTIAAQIQDQAWSAGAATAIEQIEGQSGGQGFVAAISAAEKEARNWAACEKGRGCLSDRPSKPGSAQPVAETFERAAAGLKAALGIVNSSDEKRHELLRELRVVRDDIRVAASLRDGAERRRALAVLDTRARSIVAGLGDSSPRAALETVLAGLRKPVVMHASGGLGEAATRASEVMSDLASRLSKVMPTSGAAALPALHGPVSLGDAFDLQILKATAPYLVLSAVLELSALIAFAIMFRFYRSQLEQSAAREATHA